MLTKGFFNNQKGVMHLLALVVVLGLVAFFLFSNTFSFKDKIFQALFPKPSSNAASNINKAEEKKRQVLEKQTKLNILKTQIEGLSFNLKAHPENKDKTTKNVTDLLTQRKQLLSDLLQLDPTQAKDLLLADEAINNLKTISTDNVETKVTISGTHSKLHQDDFVNPENSTTFDLLNSGSKTYYLFGNSDVSKLRMGANFTVSGYQLDNKVVVTSLDTKVLGITSLLEPQTANASTVGTQNVAVIATTFTDSGTQGYTMTDLQNTYQGNPGHDVVSYYQEVSYGKQPLVATFFGPYQLAQTKAVGCSDTYALADTVMNAANADVNYLNYNRLVFVVDCSNIGGFTDGYVRPITTPDGTVTSTRIWIGSSAARQYTVHAHELAHNLGPNGLSHANWFICKPDVFDPPSRLGPNCNSLQYGDAFDLLSNNPIAGGGGHLNAYHKSAAGWFDPANNVTLNTPGTYTYNLAPIETLTSTPMILTILRGNSGTSLTVEYRQPIGFDSWFTGPGCPSCTETMGPSIRLAYNASGGDIQSLDTTPYSAQSTDYWDWGDYYNGAALTPGNTFTDPEYGITIQATSADTSGTTVQITIPSQTCTHASPTMTISPSTQILTPGVAGTYTATITNNDSSGCPANKFGFVQGGQMFVPDKSQVSLSPGQSTSVNISATLPSNQIVTTAGSFGLRLSSNSLGVTDVVNALNYQVTSPADTTAPTAPSSLTATAVGAGQVNLSWTASTDNVGVVGYRIWRDTTHINIINASQSSFMDLSLVPGTTYSYYVQAFDRNNNASGPSNTVTVTTPAKTDTQGPSAISSSALNFQFVSVNEVILSWPQSTDNVGVTAYFIGGTWPNDENGQYVGPNVTSVDIKGLMYGSAYTYSVRALDGDGNMSGFTGAGQTIITGAQGTFPPTQPTNLQAVATNPCQINLNWNPSTDDVSVGGYDIYRNTFKLATVTSTNYVDTRVIVGGAYQYYVQAVDNVGNFSPQSTWVWSSGSLSGPCGSTAPSPTIAPTPTPTLFPTPTPTLTPTSIPTPSPNIDITPPTVSITSPLNNSTVTRGSTVNIIANATDNVGLAKVEFYVNNSLTCTDASSPYSCSWKIPSAKGKVYTLVAKAYDLSNNTSSSTITVTAK